MSKRMTFRFPNKMESEIKMYVSENGGSQTQALQKAWKEFIEKESGTGKEKDAETIVEMFDKRYGSLLSRLKISTQESDKNSQILIEVLNTMLINNNIKDLISTDNGMSKVLTEAKTVVSDRIGRAKQKKDIG